MNPNTKTLNPRLIFCSIGFLISINVCLAQTRIDGQVKDSRGKAVPFSTVYIENTLDGATTDSIGKFLFTTSEKGKHVLIGSCIGYETVKDTIIIDKPELHFTVKLKGKSIVLNSVTITAGTLEANNDREVAILKPLDIYTNAGAQGDIAGAIQSLPGNQRVGNQTGLFVRGGDASETAFVIDGMTVQNPFSTDVPGVAQRSRFTPFQFKGIAFSSGGYSARYGQALSSVLELNTFDMPQQSTLNFGMNMSGVQASATKKWNHSAAEFTGYYANLSPFLDVSNTNFHIYDAPHGEGFSVKWTEKTKTNGLFKAFFKYDMNMNGQDIPNPDTPGTVIPFGVKNHNEYFNSSYRQVIHKFVLNTSVSYSNNTDRIGWGVLPFNDNDWRGEWRGEAWYNPSDKISLLLGSEIQRYQYKQGFDTLSSKFNELLAAGYLEAEWKPATWFAFKPGIRFERSNLLSDNSVAPRIALAFRTGKYSQISLAGGSYYQDPDKKYLLSGHRPRLEQAVHYIANYQWINNDRSFRIEGYYKTYNDLVKELNTSYNPNPYRYVPDTVKLDNSGNGYAQGIDIFWRDKATIKNFDYWIMYSYIDTKRLYENFPVKTTPVFVSSNNLNILLKYFIEPWQVNLGLSYAYASGKPYYDPISTKFLGNRTPDYQDVAFNFSYLATFGKFFTVFYLSVDNLFNRKNVYGYRYSYDGRNRYPILPAIYRGIFAGINISLTAFSKEEL
ncbi:MAG TPA: TonB-dependent receptor [Bacteroidales bacterium]